MSDAGSISRSVYPTGLTGAAVRMDVSVQQQLWPQRSDHVVEAFEADVSRVGVVADAERRAVRQQHVDAAVSALKFLLPAIGARQRPGAPSLLTLGPLIGSAVVADGTTESGDTQSRDVDDLAIGVHGSDRTRPRAGKPCTHPPRAARRIAGQIGVMIAGNEDAGRVQRIRQVLEVVERKIARPEDQIDIERADLGTPQALDRFIGNC